MNRLWIQLSLAFALVVLVTVAAVAFLADLTAGHAFRRYLTYSGTSLHQSLDRALADYYQAHGSWAGVEQVLPTPKASPGRKPLPRRHVGPPGPESSPLQIVLADREGRVVYDNHAPPAGQKLTREEMAAAQDIELDGQVIGRLVLSLPLQEARLGPLEQVFVARLRWLLVGGALLAGQRRDGRSGPGLQRHGRRPGRVGIAAAADGRRRGPRAAQSPRHPAGQPEGHA